MNKEEILAEEAAEYIAQKIDEAGGSEVFFRASYNFENDIIKKVEVLARGNQNMAPAIITQLNPGDCVIHNHPAGDLKPSPADIRLASRLGNRGVGFIIVDNSGRESYTVVEPESVGYLKPLPRQEIIDKLKKGGEMEDILPNFRERREQLEVLDRIITSFNEDEEVLIEAGTGTGKSFAYLLPALYWNNINDQSVIISTNTINLQQQLLDKDLVQLKKVVPFDFKSTLVKGRSNYVCMRKLKNILNREDSIDDEELINVARYVDNCRLSSDYSGSYSEFDFSVSGRVWRDMRSESELCPGNQCPFVDDCFFQKARREILKSDIMVVNHHLLLSDMILKEEQAQILPTFNRLVIDEAHNLPEAAHHLSGLRFYPPELLRTLNRLINSGNSPLLKLRNFDFEISQKLRDVILKKLDEECWPKIKRLQENVRQYNHELSQLMPEESYKNRLQDLDLSREAKESWMSVGNNLLNLLNGLRDSIFDLTEILSDNGNDSDNHRDQIRREVSATANKINNFCQALELNLSPETRNDEYVFWLERENREGNEASISQENALICVDGFLQKILYSRLNTMIMTSATLAVNDDFTYFKSRLGVNNASTLKIDSPFDYSSQTDVYAPSSVPPVSSGNFVKDIVHPLAAFLGQNSGGSLLLFTSYEMLNETRRRIAPLLNNSQRKILVQGEASRRQILKRLKASGRAVLLGTASFWEGIDVPGRALSSLIIMRLPFSVPTDPLVAARQEMIDERGESSFYEEALPRAVLKFKQGFGRLIRSRSDSGTVLILDKRIITKSYGQIFIDSLPEEIEVKECWPKN